MKKKINKRSGKRMNGGTNQEEVELGQVQESQLEEAPESQSGQVQDSQSGQVQESQLGQAQESQAVKGTQAEVVNRGTEVGYTAVCTVAKGDADNQTKFRAVGKILGINEDAVNNLIKFNFDANFKKLTTIFSNPNLPARKSTAPTGSKTERRETQFGGKRSRKFRKHRSKKYLSKKSRRKN